MTPPPHFLPIPGAIDRILSRNRKAPCNQGPPGLDSLHFLRRLTREPSRKQPREWGDGLMGVAASCDAMCCWLAVSDPVSDSVSALAASQLPASRPPKHPPAGHHAAHQPGADTATNLWTILPRWRSAACCCVMAFPRHAVPLSHSRKLPRHRQAPPPRCAPSLPPAHVKEAEAERPT
jgi:hypothetical protein